MNSARAELLTHFLCGSKGYFSSSWIPSLLLCFHAEEKIRSFSSDVRSVGSLLDGGVPGRAVSPPTNPPGAKWPHPSDMEPSGGKNTHSDPVPTPQQLLLQVGLSALSALPVVPEEVQSGSNCCYPHCYQAHSWRRNVIVPPHSLSSLFTHFSKFSPKKAP